MHCRQGLLDLASTACLEAAGCCATQFQLLAGNQDDDLDCCRNEVAEQLYMLAISHLQSQDIAAADGLLSLLGLRFRLCSQAFLAEWPACLSSREYDDDGEGAAVMSELSTINPGKRVSTIDAAGPLLLQQPLPGDLLRGLQKGFAPDSSFWQCHDYHEPSTPFFSYFYRLAARPSNLIEASIQSLAGALRRSHAAGPWLQDVVAAEWWAHSRASDGCHQLHFDVDESRLRQGSEHYALHHPAASSILFLHANQGCGPTIILDQRPADSQLASQGWCVPPCSGSCVTYPGNLLHGVLPGRKQPAESHTGSGEGPARTTLVIAWWGGSLQPRPASGPLGPARLLACAMQESEGPAQPAHTHHAAKSMVPDDSSDRNWGQPSRTHQPLLVAHPQDPQQPEPSVRAWADGSSPQTGESSVEAAATTREHAGSRASENDGQTLPVGSVSPLLNKQSLQLQHGAVDGAKMLGIKKEAHGESGHITAGPQKIIALLGDLDVAVKDWLAASMLPPLRIFLHHEEELKTIYTVS
ncbi:hypothetical protein WJX84_010775 [Apatococcus fuscideae]|uniref:Uncharacterized protein n=1 Tax=Apatococcus fuscideae TaxID=2026836 RepID=A0AAW1SZW7_9CHLO